MAKKLTELNKIDHEKVSDKWSSYFPLYQKFLAPRQNDPIRLLEIGVQNGGSLEVWSKYFPNAVAIIGCDINPKCGDLSYEDPRVRVFVGDASSADVKDEIASASPSFDLIVDDGSHKSGDIIRAFARYFPLLEPGGIYLAEDLHASYFHDYQGGTEAPYSSLNFFKRLTDYVNKEHWGADVSTDKLLSYFSEYWKVDFDPRSLDSITEVAFFNSMVLVRKGHDGENELGHRMVTGTTALVDDRVLRLDGTERLKRNQNNNPTGPLGMRLEAYPDEARRFKEELGEKGQELRAAREELGEKGQELRAAREELGEKGQELRAAREELGEKGQELRAAKEELGEKGQELRAAKEALLVANEESKKKAEKLNAFILNSNKLLDAKSSELEMAHAQIDLIAAELTQARRKPLKQFRKLIPYKVLSGLSKARPLVTEKAAARFAKSAAKRHPSLMPSLPDVTVRGATLSVETNNSSDAISCADTDDTGRLADLEQAISLSGKLLPIAESGFWDERWYKERHWEEIKSAAKQDKRIVSPLHHYVLHGWKNGYEPSPHFPFKRRMGLETDSVTDFLQRVQFDGYHFEDNAWFPHAKDIEAYLGNVDRREAKRVIYTCIVGHYDDLMQPKHIQPSWDYVCFTDRKDLLEHPQIGVWKIRPLVETHSDSSLANRWHKMHPHELFPEHEESLYLDGNVNLLSPYIFETIAERDTEILVPRHFKRTCVSEEIDVLIASRKIDQSHLRKLEELIQTARSDGFPVSWGLSENNVIFRKHHSEEIKSLMAEWWDLTETIAPRDQGHFCYLLWKYGFSFQGITFPNCRSLYKDFAVIRHNTKEEAHLKNVISQKLSPAFNQSNVAIVLSCNEAFVDFLDVLLTSIMENRSDERNYDLIILNRDVNDASKLRILENHGSHENVSIRFYDMTDVLAAFSDMDLHLEGYVPIETYNKIFLNDILDGFEKIVYIDTDIILDRDIADLFDIDLCGRAIGASPNVANIHAANAGKMVKGRNFRAYLQRELGVLNVDQYFQAGILVLDLTHRNTQKLFRKCVEKINEVKEPAFFDQCIFNSIFYGDVCFFSVEWNLVWYLQNYSFVRNTVSEDLFFEYAKGQNKPAIAHFASGDKPTNKTDWRLGDLFWKYAVRSKSKDALLGALTEEQFHSPQVQGAVEGRSVVPEMIRILVHVHLYYEDQLPFMLDALSNLGDFPRDVFFTIQQGSKINRDAVLQAEPGCQFIEEPNLGYDLFPFVDVLRRVNLSKYDYILKLHTKAPRTVEQGSVYGKNVPGLAWRDALVGSLVGSPEIARANIERLHTDRTIGALGCEDFIFSTHENNEELNYNLRHWRAYLNLNSGSRYIGGTMFLARAYPFERFKKLHNQPKLFSGESLRTGSHKNFAHVVERLCGIVVENEGLTIQGVQNNKSD